MPHRFVQHIQICAISLVVALVIAVPIGVVLGHFRRGGFLAVSVSNIGRAVPAIAILLIAVLAFGIADPPEYLTRIGVVSIPGVPRARAARDPARAHELRTSACPRSTPTSATRRGAWA